MQVIRENPEAFMRMLQVGPTEVRLRFCLAKSAAQGGMGGGGGDPVAAMLAAAQGGAGGGGAPPGAGQQALWAVLAPNACDA